VLENVLLRPLPYPHPENLVEIWNTYPPQVPKGGLSPGDYADWHQQAISFSEIRAAIKTDSLILPEATKLIVDAKAVDGLLHVYLPVKNNKGWCKPNGGTQVCLRGANEGKGAKMGKEGVVGTAERAAA
jgi:hypothetical protein